MRNSINFRGFLLCVFTNILTSFKLELRLFSKYVRYTHFFRHRFYIFLCLQIRFWIDREISPTYSYYIPHTGKSIHLHQIWYAEMLVFLLFISCCYISLLKSMWLFFLFQVCWSFLDDLRSRIIGQNNIYIYVYIYIYTHTHIHIHIWKDKNKLFTMFCIREYILVMSKESRKNNQLP